MLHMGKAKLARRGMLLDCLPLTPTRPFNMANAYSEVKINKWSFLVGAILYLIWRILVREGV